MMRSVRLVPRRVSRGTALLAAVGVVVGVAGATTASAQPSAHGAVHGGKRVQLSEAPWIASLAPVDGRGRAAKIPGHALSCTAAVIGRKRLLTASHCLELTAGVNRAVRVGTDDLIGNSGRIFKIARAWSARLATPGEYRFGNGSDTAVVETTEPLGVPAIALGTERPKTGEAVTVFGFGYEGRNLFPEGVARPVLKRWDASVLTPCPSVVTDPALVRAYAGDESGTRPGDSGGPLVVFRDGVPQLVGDTSQVANEASGFADVVALRGFVETLPAYTQVPLPTRPVQITGKVAPGGTVSCKVNVSPKPQFIDYEWFIGGTTDERSPEYYATSGKRLPYLLSDSSARVSQRQTLKLPSTAAGKRLQCTATAGRGGLFRTVNVVTHQGGAALIHRARCACSLSWAGAPSRCERRVRLRRIERAEHDDVDRAVVTDAALIVGVGAGDLLGEGEEAVALCALGDAGAVAAGAAAGLELDLGVGLDVVEPGRVALAAVVGRYDDRVLAVAEVEQGRDALDARLRAGVGEQQQRHAGDRHDPPAREAADGAVDLRCDVDREPAARARGRDRLEEALAQAAGLRRVDVGNAHR